MLLPATPWIAWWFMEMDIVYKIRVLHKGLFIIHHFMSRAFLPFTQWKTKETKALKTYKQEYNKNSMIMIYYCNLTKKSHDILEVSRDRVPKYAPWNAFKCALFFLKSCKSCMKMRMKNTHIHRYVHDGVKCENARERAASHWSSKVQLKI